MYSHSHQKIPHKKVGARRIPQGLDVARQGVATEPSYIELQSPGCLADPMMRAAFLEYLYYFDGISVLFRRDQRYGPIAVVDPRLGVQAPHWLQVEAARFSLQGITVAFPLNWIHMAEQQGSGLFNPREDDPIICLPPRQLWNLRRIDPTTAHEFAHARMERGAICVNIKQARKLIASVGEELYAAVYGTTKGFSVDLKAFICQYAMEFREDELMAAEMERRERFRILTELCSTPLAHPGNQGAFHSIAEIHDNLEHLCTNLWRLGLFQHLLEIVVTNATHNDTTFYSEAEARNCCVTIPLHRPNGKAFECECQLWFKENKLMKWAQCFSRHARLLMTEEDLDFGKDWINPEVLDTDRALRLWFWHTSLLCEKIERKVISRIWDFSICELLKEARALCRQCLDRRIGTEVGLSIPHSDSISARVEGLRVGILSALEKFQKTSSEG